MRLITILRLNKRCFTHKAQGDALLQVTGQERIGDQEGSLLMKPGNREQ
jgi:hypothetical protein